MSCNNCEIIFEANRQQLYSRRNIMQSLAYEFLQLGMLCESMLSLMATLLKIIHNKWYCDWQSIWSYLYFSWTNKDVTKYGKKPSETRSVIKSDEIQAIYRKIRISDQLIVEKPIAFALKISRDIQIFCSDPSDLLLLLLFIIIIY